MSAIKRKRLQRQRDRIDPNRTDCSLSVVKIFNEISISVIEDAEGKIWYRAIDLFRDYRNPRAAVYAFTQDCEIKKFRQLCPSSRYRIQPDTIFVPRNEIHGLLICRKGLADHLFNDLRTLVRHKRVLIFRVITNCLYYYGIIIQARYYTKTVKELGLKFVNMTEIFNSPGSNEFFDYMFENVSWTKPIITRSVVCAFRIRREEQELIETAKEICEKLSVQDNNLKAETAAESAIE